MTEEFEETLCLIKEVHVFKIPPNQVSSDGYKAEGWTKDPALHLWSGSCRVVAAGEDCFVRLEDTITGKSFAVCTVNTKPGAPKAVEKVIDSSRFFVLRIENNGKHAFIGIGFQERTEAFDFNVALQDHQKYFFFQIFKFLIFFFFSLDGWTEKMFKQLIGTINQKKIIQ